MLLTPVPVSAIEFGEFVALLVSTICPIAEPVAFGAKSTCRLALWPAASVTPDKLLVAMNPVPETFICEMSRLEFPVFFTVTSSALVPPTLSFPKLKAVLESDNVRVALVPVPVKVMAKVGLLALLYTAMSPIYPTAEVGANLTVALIIAPAAIVPADNPLMLNPVPLIVALEIVRELVPMFFS